MTVYSLIYRRNVSFRVRVQAFMNLFCTSYMSIVTVFTTYIGLSKILPLCVDSDSWMFLLHRIVIVYLFLCTAGNFCTCILTDPSVHSDRSASGHHEQTTSRDASRQKVTDKNGLKRRNVSKDTLNGSNDDDSVAGPRAWCLVCKVFVTDRMHHCYLCEKCVVKRDHHCFFMGVCIGRRNHKYFIFFLLYMGIGTMYSLLVLVKFLNVLYGIRFYGPQTFVTLFAGTAIRIIQGEIPAMGFSLAFVLLYISLFGTVLSFGFFFWHMIITACGQTTYEAKVGNRKYSKGSYRQNMAEVFDSGSFVALLVPFYDLLRPPVSPI